MTSSAEQMRALRGPALLSYGFRPFFFGTGVWAALAMTLWVPMLSGHLTLPTAFDPVSWHAHEFLFGYLTAVIAGFLLTAVPNWTGRLPIVGWPLGALFALWLIGRLAVGVSLHLPPLAVALADLAMPLALAAVIGREIVAGKNWRNLIVLAMLGVLTIGNGIFHLEAARGDYAAQGYGLKIGLGAVVMMIAVIGGADRAVFHAQLAGEARAWAATRAADAEVRQGGASGPACRSCGVGRLARSPGDRHASAGGGNVARRPVGAMGRTSDAGRTLGRGPAPWLCFPAARRPGNGCRDPCPRPYGTAAAQHLWMGGAAGLMTLAVMTRATLGHTGQTLTAGPGTVFVYVALIVAVLARFAAGIWPAQASVLHMVAGTAWILSFAGFAVLYGRLLLRLPAAKRI